MSFSLSLKRGKSSCRRNQPVIGMSVATQSHKGSSDPCFQREKTQAHEDEGSTESSPRHPSWWRLRPCDGHGTVPSSQFTQPLYLHGQAQNCRWHFLQRKMSWIWKVMRHWVSSTSSLGLSHIYTGMHRHEGVGRRDYDLTTLNTVLKSLVIFHSSDRWPRAPKHLTTVSFQPLTFNPDSSYSPHISMSMSQVTTHPAFCVTSILYTFVWKGHASSDLTITSFTGKNRHKPICMYPYW